MNIWTKSWSIIKIVLPAIMIMLALQQFPDFFDHIFAKKTTITESDGPAYVLDIKDLAPGNYLVSIGRPRAHCDIFLDNEPIFVGKSTVRDIRPNLLASAGFQKGAGHKSITVDCDHFQSGFGNRLSFKPKVYSYNQGMIAHLMRASIEIFVGPVSSLILLIVSLIHFFSAQDRSKSRSTVFLVYAIISLIYSVSLAYYTRLFLDGMLASQLHVTLRFVFSLGFNFIINPDFSKRRPLVLLHFVCIPLSFLIGTDTNSLEMFYRIAYLLFPVSTYVSFLDLIKKNSQSRIVFFMQSIALSWAIAQSFDFIKLNTNVGFYAAPLFLMLVSAFLAYKVINDIKLRMLSESLGNQIHRITHNGGSIESMINEIVTEIGRLDRRIQVSSSVDGFLISRSSKSGISRHILPETTEHEIAAKQSLEFPVSEALSFKISAAASMPPYVIHEVLDILDSAKSSFFSAEKTMLSTTASMNSSLSKLRTVMGEGVHDRFIGAVFIDIVDYSKFAESIGNAYTTFISNIIIPRMISHVSSESLPEVVRGDEVLFIITQETSQTLDVPIGINSFLSKMMSFISKDISEICLEHGFPKAEFRIGFTAGEGTLVVDSIQVRTSGDHINRAKRLQDSCKKNEVWTDSSTVALLKSSNLIELSRSQIVVKKNVIEAVKVGVKRAA
jgi:hypothetical protein